MRFFLLIVLISQLCFAHETEQLKIGNLALHQAFQPSPLFSFGQNIVDRNDVLFEENFFITKGDGFRDLVSVSSLLFGLTDNTSLFVNIPIFDDNIRNINTRGLSDIFIWAEHAYYQNAQYTYTNQATVLGGIYIPSGITDNVPDAGNGGVSYFFATTASHTGIDWYAFGSLGYQFIPEQNKSDIGDTLLYQGGLGHNLGYLDEKIFIALLEVNGVYTQRNSINGFPDSNSGGNIIYLGPSFYFANKKIVLQTGILFPIYQELFGNQSKNKFLWGFSFIWYFDS